jgi:hypothetical protein
VLDDRRDEIDVIADLLPSRVSHELGNIMSKEEEALYDLTESFTGTLSEDDGTNAESGKRKAPRPGQIGILRGLTALDSIIGLGPLGPSCEGPFLPPQQEAGAASINPDAAVVAGTPALIIPCGYGSSGGLGIVTTPGRDERAVLSEVDCLGAECVFSFRSSSLVLMGTVDNGIRILRMQGTSSEHAKDEGRADSVDLIELQHADCLANFEEGDGSTTRQLFTQASLLSCAELATGKFVLAVSLPLEMRNQPEEQYAVAFVNETEGFLEVTEIVFLPGQEGNGDIVSISPMESDGTSHSEIVFACAWSNGVCTLVVLDANGLVKVCEIVGADQEDDPMEVDESDDADDKFYMSTRIVAVDLFRAPLNFFPQSLSQSGAKGKEKEEKQLDNAEESEGEDDLYFASEQDEKARNEKKVNRSTEGDTSDAPWKTPALFFAICRQSGKLEVFLVSDMIPDQEPTPVWAASGCGHGISSLSWLSISGTEYRIPRQHKVHVREMRFFYCGPTRPADGKDVPGSSRPLCLGVENSAGDLHLYAADARAGPGSSLRFGRVPLKNVTRQSQEQTKLYAKLKRKGIVSGNAEGKFLHNKLHRFQGLSKQDGLFAAVTRPLWLLAERGRPVAVAHRLRHAAPAGGKALPVSGFCSNLVRLQP